MDGDQRDGDQRDGDRRDEPTPLRADARRNREQILQAARALFTRVGPDVPMDEIARAAGVGVGTLYRRFPDRDELIKAVSLDDFARLVELARTVDDEKADPAGALETLLRSAVELRLGLTVAALSGRAFRAVQDSPEIIRDRGEVVAVAERLLRRAQDHGDIRSDIGVGDALTLVMVLSRLAPLSGSDLGEMVAHRMTALLLDGLRTGPGSALPGRPLDGADVDQLRRQDRLARGDERSG